MFLWIGLGDQTLQTKTIRIDSSGHGQWGETLILTSRSLEEIFPLTLKLRLMEAGIPGQNVCIGTVPVPVNRIPIAQELETWFELEPTSQTAVGKPPGQVRIGFNLSGEFRPEIRALLRMLGVYANAVDQGLEHVADAGQKAKPYITNRIAAAAAVPLGGTVLASIPLILVASPLLFPVFIIAGSGIAVVAVIVGILALSSKQGRLQIAPLVQPVIDKLRSDAVGQQLLYATGPRPHIYAIIKLLAPQEMWSKLAVSLIVDFIGCTSYALPIFGEVGDVFWAPLSAVLISAMYSESSPYAAYIGFIEEILPFTDIIPTATLAWLREFTPELVMMMKAGHGVAAEISPESVH
jgi:hypothetical protein